MSSPLNADRGMYPQRTTFQGIGLLFALLSLIGCSSREGEAARAQAAPRIAASSALPPDNGAGTPPRYLHVVYCNGVVDQLDLQEQRKVASFTLGERSGEPPAVARLPSTGIKPDSCLARPVNTDGHAPLAQHEVQLVAADQLYRDDAGRKPYRLLRFSLPDWHLLQASDLGVFDVLNGSPPRLRRQADGTWLPAPESASPDAAELAGYQAAQGLAFAQTTQWSGDGALVAFASGGPPARAQAGLADRRQQLFARLEESADGTGAAWQLAPGGRYAQRQTQKLPAPANAAPLRNMGELRLYGADGQQLAQIRDERIAGDWHGIALTPNGLAVFTDRHGSYRFVTWLRTFGNEAVADLLTDDEDGARPGLVYSLK